MNQTMWHDQAGNSWQITLDIDVMRRVRAGTGYDLARLFTDEGMNTLAADPILLADVIWQCIKPQAEAKQITHADFIKGMRAQAIENASDALIQAAIDFLPPSRAALLTRLRDKVADTMTVWEQQAAAAIDQMNLQPPANSGKA